MKRLLYLITRLYPRSWRARYGDEFRALLEDIEPRWSDVWNLFTNGLTARGTAMNAWQWMTIGAVLGLAAHAGMFATHGHQFYTSTSILQVPAASPTDAAEKVGPFVRDAMSRPHLLEVMRHHNLYARERAAGPERTEAAIDKFANTISIKPSNEGLKGYVGFAVAVRDRDPGRAQRLSREFMSRVVDAICSAKQSRQLQCLDVEVLKLPNLSPESIDWSGSGWILACGALAGAVSGLLIVLLHRGWRMLAS